MTRMWSSWNSVTASSAFALAIAGALLVAGALPAAAQLPVQTAPAAPAAPVVEAKPAAPAMAIASMEHLDDSREINIGDTLNFRVIEDRDPAIGLLVTDSGEVDIPYVGRVRAKGETCRSLARQVKTLLEREYYHNATVLIAMDSFGSKSRGKIYVVGQVLTPGSQELPLGETLTVSKAILSAGGMGDFADKRKVKLVRKRHADDKEPEITFVDVKRILEEGRAGEDPELKDEDLIIVPQRMINF